jgi:hypothetical protein
VPRLADLPGRAARCPAHTSRCTLPVTRRAFDSGSRLRASYATTAVRDGARLLTTPARDSARPARPQATLVSGAVAVWVVELCLVGDQADSRVADAVSRTPNIRSSQSRAGGGSEQGELRAPTTTWRSVSVRVEVGRNRNCIYLPTPLRARGLLGTTRQR